MHQHGEVVVRRCLSTMLTASGMAHRDDSMWLPCVQVYMRRKRWVLALQAMKRAAGIGGPGSPEAHCMVLRFCHAAQSEQVSRLACLL